MEVKQELEKAGIKPGKGQNFLESDAAAQALAEAGELEGKKALEIGPGLGKITEKLVKLTEELFLVEKNRNLASYIERRFPDTKVLRKDFLSLDLKGMEVERIVGNIPFQISSDVLEKIGEAQIQSALIVQRELADKLVAEPGESEYGFFTAKMRYFFVPVKVQEIPSRSFYPEPEVDASIVKLFPGRERHRIKDGGKFLKVTKALFTHKRKKLRNAFVDSRHILELEKEEAKMIRDNLPYSEKRVVNLEIAEIAEVARFLEEYNEQDN